MPFQPMTNCGKNVALNPRNVVIAAKRAHASEYMRPVTLGHQKCSPAIYADTVPPTMTKWKCAITKYVSVA